jgi:hypothetical protein
MFTTIWIHNLNVQHIFCMTKRKDFNILMLFTNMGKRPIAKSLTYITITLSGGFNPLPKMFQIAADSLYLCSYLYIQQDNFSFVCFII